MSVAGDPTELQTSLARGDVQGWRVMRMTLLVLVLGLIAAAAVLGRAPGELNHLSEALSSHRLAEVTVIGDGLPGDARGCATQQVVWRRDGLLRYVQLVVHRGDAAGCSVGGSETLDTGITDVAVWVRQLDPGVTIHREPWPRCTGTLGRWTVPPGLLAFALPAWLAGLYVLVAGPQPWRATRWAWFWLSGSVVGALAFLVLSGPTPGLPEPRRPQRRLTAGWAFFLGLALAAVAPTWLVLSS
jgi:hypothetical protein